MAHRTTGHRRSSAVPDSKAFTPHRTISSTSHLPTEPLSTKRVNPIHKLRPPHRPTSPPASAATTDVRLQAKSLSVSAIFDSSKSSLSKPNRQPRTAPKSEKETHKPAKPLNKAREFPKLHEAPDFKESVLDMRKLSVSLDGGRRRSLGGARVDVADFLANNGARIVSVDMPPFMQIHAVDFARKTRDSLEKFTARTLASTLKKEFDGVYGPAWHCIVGTSFGSFVTHSVGGFLYFSLDQKMYILLFKTTVQRAD